MRDSFNRMEASFFAQVGFDDWMVVPNTSNSSDKEANSYSRSKCAGALALDPLGERVYLRGTMEGSITDSVHPTASKSDRDNQSSQIDILGSF